MYDLDKIIKDINQERFTYFFNKEILPIIKELQSESIMSTYSEEDILAIRDKYKLNENEIASAIYKNEYASSSLVEKVINENQHQNVLMLVLGRRNVSREAIDKVIDILGKAYVIDRIDDFEFLMENTNSPFTHKNCPLSQTVIDELKNESPEWHYVYEKYTKNVDDAFEIIENDSLNEKRISALAYNSNLPSNVRNNAFDIAYDPIKLYKFATSHMTNTLYFSAVEALFETDIKTPNYEEITKEAEGVLANLLSADKLSPDHMYDFVCRFLNKKNYKNVLLLERIVEKAESTHILKKTLEIPKIKNSNIGMKVYKNENLDYITYEDYIKEELKQVLHLQTVSPRGLQIRNIMEQVLDCYENRHCVVPPSIIKQLDDDCFKFVSLMTNKTNSKVKEVLCDSGFERKTVEFFGELKNSLNRNEAYNVAFELYKKALYETFTQNSAPKALKDGIAYDFTNWSTFMSTTKRREGITKEEYHIINKAFRKHEKQMPREFSNMFKRELNGRAKHTVPKFEINSLLGTDLLQTSTFNFSLFEMDIKKLSEITVQGENTIKSFIKELNLDKSQLQGLSNQILKELGQLAKCPIAERITFYNVIENANMLYSAIKEIQLEKDMSEKIKEEEIEK